MNLKHDILILNLRYWTWSFEIESTGVVDI